MRAPIPEQEAPRTPSPDILVVGAGAAGLWAAAAAAKLGRSILLLEKTPRTGTKVLASGGTRCNLTTTLDAPRAARLFGSRGERFLRTAFRVLPPLAVREHFARLGVPTVEAPLEKVFPASQRARDVRDALERDARANGVEIRCDAPVLGVERASTAWFVHLANGETLAAPRLLLCPGGASYPRTGTTGDGYAWLRALDLELVEPVPALVPLASPAPWVRELTGIALQEVEARLLDEAGRELGRRARPIVFTHHGVSGPGAMDLSGHVARGGSGFTLALDVVPQLDREALRARLVDAAATAGAPRVSRALELALPKRLLDAVALQAELPERDPCANQLSRAQRHALVEALKGLAVPISGTLGFDQAEVTAGGLALGEVDPGSMRVRRYEGLYVFGELLDLDGPIGGLNFQSAFATAELAARHASAP